MYIPYPHDLITYSGSDFLREQIIRAADVITILDTIVKPDITDHEKLEATEKIIKTITLP